MAKSVEDDDARAERERCVEGLRDGLEVGQAEEIRLVHRLRCSVLQSELSGASSHEQCYVCRPLTALCVMRNNDS